MNAPGKGLLKVASMLLIIFGAIATAISIIGLIGCAMYFSPLRGSAGILIATIIMILFASVPELILGIVGRKKCTDPAKGAFFIASGIILCVLSLVGFILSIAYGSFRFTSAGIELGLLTIIGFVLPVLYIIGGFMNKKAVVPGASNQKAKPGDR